MENEDLKNDLPLALTEAAQEEATVTEEGEYPVDTPDYGDIEKEDLLSLRREFPELCDISSITELPNPIRYGALRDLGLEPREAYLATSSPRIHGKAHLRSHVPGGAASQKGSMPIQELSAARELFGNLTDAELQRLYKKVTR